MKTCLIVDDSRLARKVARHFVSKLHFECAEAEDGADGLQYCAAVMPDVVLLDWNMPNLMGIEFAQTLQKTHTAMPKIIFCTTENFVPHIERAIMEGYAHGYIMKPIDDDVISEKFYELGLLN